MVSLPKCWQNHVLKDWSWKDHCNTRSLLNEHRLWIMIMSVIIYPNLYWIGCFCYHPVFYSNNRDPLWPSITNHLPTMATAWILREGINICHPYNVIYVFCCMLPISIRHGSVLTILKLVRWTFEEMPICSGYVNSPGYRVLTPSHMTTTMLIHG